MAIVAPPSTGLSSSKPSPMFACVNFHSLPSSVVTHRTETLAPKPVVCAIWKRRRSRSRRSNRIFLESVALLASNLNVLPDPLNFLIREFAGGGGGKSGFRNGFGGGSDGSRRRGERQLGFLILIVVSGLLLCVALDGGRGVELSKAVPIVLAMGVICCLLGGWKREIRGWLLGFCCGASMAGLGLRNGKLVRLSQRFRTVAAGNNPIRAILGKKRRW